MKVDIATSPEAWDQYVSSVGRGHLYHRWVWRQVIEQSFGHKPYYLTANENNTIRGVLPLVWMRSRLFGSFLVSIPFFSYGGILADTDEAREKLLASAEELARTLRATHIELRQGNECTVPWKVRSSK